MLHEAIVVDSHEQLLSRIQMAQHINSKIFEQNLKKSFNKTTSPDDLPLFAFRHTNYEPIERSNFFRSYIQKN